MSTFQIIAKSLLLQPVFVFQHFSVVELLPVVSGIAVHLKKVDWLINPETFQKQLRLF